MIAISVIVPVYNVLPYLERCVNSILCQTYKEFELVLVDDGSTDGSSKLCDILQKKDPRIIVIHKKNGGLSDARNVGIKNSSGTGIVFVDSDDMIVPNALEILVELYENTKSDIIISSKYKTFQDNVAVEKVQRGKGETFNPECAVENIFCNNSRWEAWGNLYERKLFDGSLFPKNKLYEDLATIPIIVLKAKKITFVDAAIYLYYKRADSIMGNSKKIVKKDLVDICEMLVQVFEKNIKNTSIRKNTISGVMMELASRVELAQHNEKENKYFIKQSRKCIRKNCFSIMGSQQLSWKRKIYCCSFGFYFEKIYLGLHKLIVM